MAICIDLPLLMIVKMVGCDQNMYLCILYSMCVCMLAC
jgi:hypothetical protein